LRRARVAAAACCLFGLTALAAGDGSSPTAVVESLHEGLTDVASQSLDLAQRYERLLPLIERTHDLPYIAELTIRRQWRNLSAAERERFVEAFERLSVTTYASRFAGVAPGAFEEHGAAEPQGESGRIEVRSAIVRGDGSKVPLDYLLHETDQGWRIVNILADGVSDLALKRAEYQQALEKGTIDDLIAVIDAQTAALE
jgi:phospholipid transport system substrate-binding protein